MHQLTQSPPGPGQNSTEAPRFCLFKYLTCNSHKTNVRRGKGNGYVGCGEHSPGICISFSLTHLQPQDAEATGEHRWSSGLNRLNTCMSKRYRCNGYTHKHGNTLVQSVIWKIGPPMHNWLLIHCILLKPSIYWALQFQWLWKQHFASTLPNPLKKSLAFTNAYSLSETANSNTSVKVQTQPRVPRSFENCFTDLQELPCWFISEWFRNMLYRRVAWICNAQLKLVLNHIKRYHNILCYILLYTALYCIMGTRKT